ncbi:MAG: sulfite exporter TauE/SafE family protein [Anaerobutyricum sp.]
MERRQLYIDGMTCINCQKKIENCLRKRVEIKEASVSYETGVARVLYDANKITLQEIIRIINDLGYDVKFEANSRKDIVLRTAKELVVILAVFLLLQHFGILNRLAPGSLADASMGYGMLFMIGLITLVHCIAMCGGINLLQTLQKETSKDISRKMFQNTLMYNMGRVVSYTIIGSILGAVGGLAGIGDGLRSSFLLQGSLKLFAGIVMIIMGINMLGIFQGIRGCLKNHSSKLQKISKLHKIQTSFLHKKRIPFVHKKISGGRKTPFIIGICNGFMPCGSLQSMQIVALASGNMFTGAFSIFCFSLGTVPLMLGVGSVVSALGKHFTRKMLRVGAILVVVMGLSMMMQGTSLSGLDTKVANVFSTKEGSQMQADNRNVAVEKNGVQYVSSTLESGHYPDIIVKTGEPVEWTIKASEKNINGCNYKILLQDFNQEHTFESGKNVIKFTPEKEGTYTYSCWMGMITGKIYVKS